MNMEKRNSFSNGYSFSRIINGCWQLSAEHCINGMIGH